MRVVLLLVALSMPACASVHATEEQPPPPIASAPLAGAVVAEISDGDVLYPQFSPDGRTLAYVKVLVDATGVELDEVYLYSLDTGRRVRLLDTRTAKEFATYDAYVFGLEWESPTRLVARISDGDVDATRVTFDTTSRKVVRTESEPSGDEEAMNPTLALDAQTRAARDRALDLYPDIDASTLDGSLADTGFATPDGRLVYQDREGAVRLVDVTRKRRMDLAPAQAGEKGSLHGGTYFGSSVLLLLQSWTPSHLDLVDANGARRVLATFGTISVNTRFRAIYRSASRLLLRVSISGGAERGDDALYLFEGTTLVKSSDYAEFADAAVSPDGRRIAFVLWNADDTRRIVVRELGGTR